MWDVSSMNVIVLAGGFAKRMWPLTKDHPKHLLDVGGRPMLSYVLEKISQLDGVSHVYVSTNLKFKEQFQAFLKEHVWDERVELFIEDAKAEEEKLGSIGALNYLIQEKDIHGELLIIGGDNLFEFSLKEMARYAHRRGGDAVAVYDVGELRQAKKYGIVKLDRNEWIIDFVEKPEKPPSTLAATACYFFTPTTVERVKQYITEGGNPDAMGHFISWLHIRQKVFGYRFQGPWFDIGSLESLKEADEYFRKKM